MKRKIFNIIKKSSELFFAFALMFMSLGIAPFVNEVIEATEINTLTLQATLNDIEIDSTDANQLIYKKDGVVAGTVKVKIGANELRPVMSGRNAIFQINSYAGERYQVAVEMNINEGYDRGSEYTFDGVTDFVPGSDIPGSYTINVDITSNAEHTLSFVMNQNTPPAPEEDQDPNPGPNPPQPNPGDGGVAPSEVRSVIIAKFEGISSSVNIVGDNIIVPENWTKGSIELYVLMCDSLDGKIIPYNEDLVEGTDYLAGSVREARMDIEGINNLDEINRSISVTGEKKVDQKLIVNEDFINYGSAGLHVFLPNVDDNLEPYVNKMIKLITSDVIFVRAEAPLSISFSYGSAIINSAPLNLKNDKTGEVAIFFGNTETTLIAEGSNVEKIAKVEGGKSVKYNNDGSATITLPSLSEETTTSVNVTFEMNDGKTYTKKIDIIRTAIDLKWNDAGGDGTLEAGYVINKAYLYDNKNHDDAIFNAYLQVILYKDDVVVGFRQIKIDDEDFVNSLDENESGAMEVYGEDKILLYGKALNDTIEGVNKASVFLTNGPIDANSDTLPSIEFGIGAGVEITWEGR